MDLNDGGLLRLLLGERYTGEAYTRTYVLLILAAAVLAYLLGSLRPSLFFGRSEKTEAKKPPLIAYLCDLLCCALAIFLGGLSTGFFYIKGLSYSDGCFVASLFCVFGCVFPAFHRFSGGAVLLPIAVACLAVAPIAFAILVLLYLLVLFISKYHALAAVSVGALYPIVLNGYYKILAVSPEPGLAAVATILSAILVVYCYRENLSRISSQTEPKFDFSEWRASLSKKDKEPSDENDR